MYMHAIFGIILLQRRMYILYTCTLPGVGRRVDIQIKADSL